MISFIFLFNLHWNLFLKVKWQYVGVSSGNGLASNRRSAIIWTNDDHVHCRMYAALGGNELTDDEFE